MRQSPTTISHKTYICLPPKISRCCGGGTPDCSSTFSLIRVIYCDRRASSEDGYVSMKVYALAIISEGCLPYLQDRCQARSMWYFGQRHAHGISWQFAQAPLCLLMSKDFGLSAQPFSILESVQTHLYFDQHDLVYERRNLVDDSRGWRHADQSHGGWVRFTACHFLENLPSPIFFRHVAFIIDGSTSIAKRAFDICEYFGADFF